MADLVQSGCGRFPIAWFFVLPFAGGEGRITLNSCGAQIMTTKKAFCLAVPAILGGILFSLAAQATENFQANLGPAPLTAANRANIQGRGSATAVLDGRKLSVSGTFGGLVSPATDAKLNLGLVMGAPGPSILDLKVSQDVSGTVSGELTLTSAQVAALKSGKLYIQINSQKAATGNLWGWLEPQHDSAAPGVPQQGDWYMPGLLND